jgi:hypothetical protein
MNIKYCPNSKEILDEMEVVSVEARFLPKKNPSDIFKRRISFWGLTGWQNDKSELIILLNQVSDMNVPIGWVVLKENEMGTVVKEVRS